MSNIKQIVGVVLGSAILVAALMYMVSGNNNTSPGLLLSEDGVAIEAQPPVSLDVLQEQEKLAITNIMNPIAVFTTNKGVFKIELFADQMPVTTGNFIKLAEEGYYDGIKFHRIIPGFMIQGGDPGTKTDNIASYGQGGPGYTIQDEFVDGEKLTNLRGTISMANTGQPNSGGSQFFINTADNTNLDFDKPPFTSKHPVFGQVVEGMDVIDVISSVETGSGDLPVEPVVIESVIISK